MSPASPSRCPPGQMASTKGNELPPQGLDPDQAAVVAVPVTARLVVDAGPGCGTARVACARVARFLRAGIPPDAILLLRRGPRPT